MLRRIVQNLNLSANSISYKQNTQYSKYSKTEVMKMGILRNTILKMSSEKKLRNKADKMFNKLNKVGFYESDSRKHMGLANKYNDYVNAIGSKCAGKLPKREHGWYLRNDD